MLNSQGFSRRQRLVNIGVVLAILLIAALTFLKIIEKQTANILLMSLGVPLALYLMILKFRKR